MGVCGLLGRNIIQRPQKIARHRKPPAVLPLALIRRVVEPREPQVENDHSAIFVLQQVGRLNVAMHDPVLVSVLEAACGLDDHVDRTHQGKRAALLDDRAPRLVPRRAP